MDARHRSNRDQGRVPSPSVCCLRSHLSVAVHAADTMVPMWVQWGEPTEEDDGGEAPQPSRQGAGALALGLLSTLIDKLGMLWDCVSIKIQSAAVS